MKSSNRKSFLKKTLD